MQIPDSIQKWLETTGRGACLEAIRWLAESGVTNPADAWDRCNRPDWMLWSLEAIDYNDGNKLRLFSCACVRDVWDLLSDERSKHAVVVSEALANGRVPNGNLADACNDANDAACTILRAGTANWSASRAAVIASGGSTVWNCSKTSQAARSARVADVFNAGGSTDAARDVIRETQVNHLRRIIGNPFRS